MESVIGMFIGIKTSGWIENMARTWGDFNLLIKVNLLSLSATACLALLYMVYLVKIVQCKTI